MTLVWAYLCRITQLGQHQYQEKSKVLLHRSTCTGRQTDSRPTDVFKIMYPLPYLKRDGCFIRYRWYRSLAILTLNDEKFISLTVDHVDNNFVLLSVERNFSCYA